ncbi:hypothetical protein BDY19DRAFT_998957 [Irpex rosettiformis]|uniref:Uncharacterized protein n=1 Tax=Irpex rosettiformis TaxID=378272 RepID=A0ACB8TM04_9APHY|nr:hypothetical protein BDY19DRAFT_998957 [Irpex rosettiformis]
MSSWQSLRVNTQECDGQEEEEEYESDGSDATIRQTDYTLLGDVHREYMTGPIEDEEMEEYLTGDVDEREAEYMSETPEISPRIRMPQPQPSCHVDSHEKTNRMMAYLSGQLSESEKAEQGDMSNYEVIKDAAPSEIKGVELFEIEVEEGQWEEQCARCKWGMGGCQSVMRA